MGLGARENKGEQRQLKNRKRGRAASLERRGPGSKARVASGYLLAGNTDARSSEGSLAPERKKNENRRERKTHERHTHFISSRTEQRAKAEDCPGGSHGQGESQGKGAHRRPQSEQRQGERRRRRRKGLGRCPGEIGWGCGEDRRRRRRRQSSRPARGCERDREPTERGGGRPSLRRERRGRCLLSRRRGRLGRVRGPGPSPLRLEGCPIPRLWGGRNRRDEDRPLRGPERLLREAAPSARQNANRQGLLPHCG